MGPPKIRFITRGKSPIFKPCLAITKSTLTNRRSLTGLLVDSFGDALSHGVQANQRTRQAHPSRAELLTAQM